MRPILPINRCTSVVAIALILSWERLYVCISECSQRCGRNERLTRGRCIGRADKMPMEPRSKGGPRLVDRCLVAFPRYLTELRCVLSIGYTFPGRTGASSVATESLFRSGFSRRRERENPGGGWMTRYNDDEDSSPGADRKLSRENLVDRPLVN